VPITGQWHAPAIDGDSFVAVVECPGASENFDDNLDVLHGSCDQCPRGKYDEDRDASTECTVCPHGQYNNETGMAGSCTACPLGTLSLESAASVHQCNMRCDANGRICIKCDASMFC
jgi:hypothetical protein